MMTALAAAPPTPGNPPATVGSVLCRVQLVWVALVVNVLAYSQNPTIVPIPRSVGQVVTQGALAAALLLVLLVNARLVLRPTLFLTLLTILGLVAAVASLHNEFLLGSIFRAGRFLAFLAVLWLLTPWWGRSDMVLLHCHRRALWLVLATVIGGAAARPGMAMQFDGRLSGVLWPMPPTQVAHYAAVLLGTSAVLWLSRAVTTSHALTTIAVTGGVLILTHTRTAMLAVAVGLAVAGASLFLGHVRVRRTYALGALASVTVVSLFASELTQWLLRGQTPQEAGELTGRTKVWTAVSEHPRSRLEQLFGSGLSNQSFNGLPIDSNWVATYLDQGWFGVVVHAALILVLLMLAATHVRGPHRAVALFLVSYGVVASFTETGLFSASSYLLDLTVAAALLVSPSRAGAR